MPRSPWTSSGKAESRPARVGGPGHRAEAREERERPALGGLDEADELFVDRLLGVVPAPVRQMGRAVQEGVFVEGERAADVDLVDLAGRGAETDSQARRDRRAREHDGPVREQLRGERRRDVDRRDTQRRARPLIDPGDVVVVGRDEPVDVGPQTSGGEHGAHRRLAGFGAPRVPDLDELAENRLEPAEAGTRETDDLLEIPAERAAQSLAGSHEQRLLETLGQPGEVVDRREPRARPGAEGGTRRGCDGPQAADADRHPETVGHDVLERVGLVDDEHVVPGKDGAVGCDVSAEQVEIHDDDVGGCRRRPRPFGETLAARRATERAGALLGAHAERRPQSRVRLLDELRPVAGHGPVRPSEDPAGSRAAFVRGSFARGEDSLGPGEPGFVQPLHAEVVRAAFQHRRREAAQAGGDERDVLVSELVLEGFCRGRDDDVPARKHRGDEVRQ